MKRFAIILICALLIGCGKISEPKNKETYIVKYTYLGVEYETKVNSAYKPYVRYLDYRTCVISDEYLELPAFALVHTIEKEQNGLNN